MTKFLNLIVLLATGMSMYSFDASSKEIPFTRNPVFATKPDANIPDSKIIHFTGEVKNGKIILNWQVDQNETIDQFIVEKSNDGKKFSTVALVFSSEKINKEDYQYYEQAKTGKFIYRILLIEKNKSNNYSDKLEINNSK